MTLLLARQPGQSLPEEGAARAVGGTDGWEGSALSAERNSQLSWSWVSRSHFPRHHGRQRPQAGWRAVALALAGAGAGALGSLAGAPGAAGGRWKW